MALTDNLVLACNFEDSGDLGKDGTGANNLTNAGVTADPGQVGTGSGAWDFAGNSLKHPDNAALSIGAGDYTITLWMNPTNPGANSADVISKWVDATDKEFLFWWNKFAGQWDWRVGGDANFINVTSTVLPFGSWSFVELTWEHSPGTVGITVNNGTPTTFTNAVVSPDTAAELNVGGTVNGGTYSGNYAGNIDALHIWKRLLTADERAYLALGREYPFITRRRAAVIFSH